MTSGDHIAGIPSLRFGSDAEPGIRRRGSKRFTYVNEATGRPPSKADHARIAALVIPPAWTDVWIASSSNSHLQATGRDARGRKQYRYHDEFTNSQAENKFSDLVSFAHVLGPLRRRVDRDLRRPVLDEDRVLATIVRLLDITSLRIGNAEYSRANRSFGLTTLRNRHAAVHGSTIHLVFAGKSAHQFDLTLENRRLAKVVRGCQHLPGQQLFEYRTEEGALRAIGSGDVNEYLGEHGGAGVTAKTFRTWNATVRAAEGLADAAAHADGPTNRTINEVIDRVAEHLGNTRTVCRNSYVHPAVIESFIDGTLLAPWQRAVGRRPSGLTVVELRTLRLLRTRVRRTATGARAKS
jgi:DNA topoisomerase I